LKSGKYGRIHLVKVAVVVFLLRLPRRRLFEAAHLLKLDHLVRPCREQQVVTLQGKNIHR
jgi:hypothetical protein